MARVGSKYAYISKYPYDQLLHLLVLQSSEYAGFLPPVARQA
jgi:hypothetical protein